MSAPSAGEAGTRSRSTGQVRAGGPAGLSRRAVPWPGGVPVPRVGGNQQAGSWNPATAVVRVGRASRTPFQRGKLRPSGRDPFGRQPPAQAPSAPLLRGGWEPLEMRARRPPWPHPVRICVSSPGHSPAGLRRLPPAGRPMTTSRQQHAGRRLASSGPSDVGGKRLESPCVAACGQQLSSSSRPGRAGCTPSPGPRRPARRGLSGSTPARCWPSAPPPSSRTR